LARRFDFIFQSRGARFAAIFFPAASAILPAVAARGLSYSGSALTGHTPFGVFCAGKIPTKAAIGKSPIQPATLNHPRPGWLPQILIAIGRRRLILGL
jgi:hypothetical protein